VVDMSKSILDDQEVFLKLRPLKFQLYDWYCQNFLNQLRELYEKWEYAELCRKFNLLATNTVMGKVTFKGNVMTEEQKQPLDMTGTNLFFAEKCISCC
jgi:hypothetical protein